MRHFHFKYIRNFIIIVIALVFAGYPYLLFSHYIIPNGTAALLRGVGVIVILLSSFAYVAYLAHREHKKREEEEQAQTPEEPPSPRGY